MKTLSLAALFFIIATSTLIAQPQRTKIVAHRGSSSTAPENTIAAFKEGFYYGADAIEGDFRLTADGKIVCIHDKTTKRTGNKNLTVDKSTLSQLKGLTVGIWKRTPPEQQQIPTLKEVLSLIPKGKQLLLEIKCGPEIVPVIKRELENSNIGQELITFIAFDENVVRACKNQMPNRKAFWLVGFKQNAITRKWSPSSKTILKKLEEINADGLDCKAVPGAVNEKFVKAIRLANKELHVWTVNDVKKARYFQNLGVDSITTDKPGLLKRELKSGQQ